MSSYTNYSTGLSERMLKIGEFTGIDQSRGAHGVDPGSSPDAVNFISRYGKLYTAGGVATYGSKAVETSAYEPKDGRIYQAFVRSADGADSSKLLMCQHGRFYVSDLDGASWTPIAAGFESNDWSAVNYRDGEKEWIVLTNGVDPAQYWDGENTASMPLSPRQGDINQSTVETTVVEVEVAGQDSETTETYTDEDGVTTTVTTKITFTTDKDGKIIKTTDVTTELSAVGEELTFSKLTLLYERLWGAVVSEYPDRVYWSDTFDAQDWEFDYSDSENTGGGFLDVATFDGTRIRAIVAAFDDVLIFKDKSVHRLNGTYPGEFSLTQVYGAEGTLAPRTICHTGDKLWFLSCDGLCVYDGMQVTSLSAAGDRRLKDVWSRINDSTIQNACAVIQDGIIRLAVPLDGSIINTHVIEYDTQSGVYSLIELPGVDDWLLLREGQRETLLFLNGDQLYRYDSGYNVYGDGVNASWLSPEISCGTMSSRKSTGRIYMYVNAQSRDVERKPRMKITMISGNKSREKILQLKAGRNDIRKRVKIRGRTFRFKLENMDGDPLTIERGIEIYIEEDFD